MVRPTVVATALLATFAIMAVPGPASAAQAGWMTNGFMLSGSAALVTTAQVTEFAELDAAATPIECLGSTVRMVQPIIVAPSGGSASSITFTECSSQVPNCEIGSPTISTPPVRLQEITLDGETKDTTFTIAPQTKTIFATIKYVGELCPLQSVQPITGKVKALSIFGGLEKPEHEISVKVSMESGELKAGSSPASLRLKAVLRATGTLTWSFL